MRNGTISTDVAADPLAEQDRVPRHGVGQHQAQRAALLLAANGVEHEQDGQQRKHHADHVDEIGYAQQAEQRVARQSRLLSYAVRRRSVMPDGHGIGRLQALPEPGQRAPRDGVRLPALPVDPVVAPLRPSLRQGRRPAVPGRPAACAGTPRMSLPVLLTLT